MGLPWAGQFGGVNNVSQGLQHSGAPDGQQQIGRGLAQLGSLAVPGLGEIGSELGALGSDNAGLGANQYGDLGGADQGAGAVGSLEGERDYDVYAPDGNRITDIEHIQSGILWEEKSAQWAGGNQKWVNKQVITS